MANLVRVERGNVVLKVKDYEVQRYLNLGYNVTDERGVILKAAIPSDAGTLKKLYLDQLAKIEELESTIAKLTAENETLKHTEKAKPAAKTTTKTAKKSDKE